MSHLLGIDTSTTATKAVLVDADGEVVGVGVREYDADSPHPRWSEQDPARWWDATVGAIRDVLETTGVDGAAVDAVGVAGQMHGAVLLDASGDVLRPAILWNDQRTAAQCREIRDRVGPQRLLEVTGNAAVTGVTAPKLLWVREHEPDVWAKVAHVLVPKDHVRYGLTGTLAFDRADGSGTLLFDLAARDWSPEVLDALDLDPALFPPTHEGTEVAGTISAAAAAATGLAEGTPVVAGGGYQSANAVGVGAIDPGVVALSLGTSGVVFAASDEPVVQAEGRLHAFCHAVPDRWHTMGVMLSAAGSLRWFREAVMPGASFDDIVAEAAEAPAGSDDVLFLPYLSGERAPHPDPDATGAFVGLTTRTRRPHLARSVLEGVAFGLRDILELMVAAGVPAPAQIRGSGGGTQSPLWRQILADVLDAEIATVATAEGAAFGAALLAGVGAGWWPDAHAAADACVRVSPAAAPSADRDHYRGRHAAYQALYPALQPTFTSHG